MLTAKEAMKIRESSWNEVIFETIQKEAERLRTHLMLDKEALTPQEIYSLRELGYNVKEGGYGDWVVTWEMAETFTCRRCGKSHHSPTDYAVYWEGSFYEFCSYKCLKVWILE